MKQSNFARDHFQLVLGQVQHRDAGLSKRRSRPRNKLVVAEVQRADGGQGTKRVWQCTQEVVAEIQELHTSHFQNKPRNESVIVGSQHDALTLFQNATGQMYLRGQGIRQHARIELSEHCIVYQ